MIYYIVISKNHWYEQLSCLSQAKLLPSLVSFCSQNSLMSIFHRTNKKQMADDMGRCISNRNRTENQWTLNIVVATLIYLFTIDRYPNIVGLLEYMTINWTSFYSTVILWFGHGAHKLNFGFLLLLCFQCSMNDLSTNGSSCWKYSISRFYWLNSIELWLCVEFYGR